VCVEIVRQRLEFEDASNFVRVKASASGLMGKAVDAAASAVVRVVPGARGTGIVPVVSQPYLIAAALSDDFLKSLRVCFVGARSFRHVFCLVHACSLMQSLEVDSADYRTRLMDEEILVRLLRRLFDYYRQDSIGNTDAASRMALLWLCHCYYKHETMAEALYKCGRPLSLLSALPPACIGDCAYPRAFCSGLTGFVNGAKRLGSLRALTLQVGFIQLHWVVHPSPLLAT
jgi:hypothetical protein